MVNLSEEAVEQRSGTARGETRGRRGTQVAGPGSAGPRPASPRADRLRQGQRRSCIAQHSRGRTSAGPPPTTSPRSPFPSPSLSLSELNFLPRFFQGICCRATSGEHSARVKRHRFSLCPAQVTPQLRGGRLRAVHHIITGSQLARSAYTGTVRNEEPRAQSRGTAGTRGPPAPAGWALPTGPAPALPGSWIGKRPDPSA